MTCPLAPGTILLVTRFHRPHGEVIRQSRKRSMTAGSTITRRSSGVIFGQAARLRRLQRIVHLHSGRTRIPRQQRVHAGATAVPDLPTGSQRAAWQRHRGSGPAAALRCGLRFVREASQGAIRAPEWAARLLQRLLPTTASRAGRRRRSRPSAARTASTHLRRLERLRAIRPRWWPRRSQLERPQR